MVHAIGQGAGRVPGYQRSQPVAGEEGTSAEKAVSGQREHGRAHGVLRNLLAGHYEGMARLRLSQNFAAEIQAMAAQEEAAATTSVAASFKAQATALVGDFVDGVGASTFDFEAVDAARDQFFQALDDIEGTTATLDGLEAALAAAVEAFADALEAAIVADSGEVEEGGDIALAEDRSAFVPPSDIGEGAEPGEPAETAAVAGVLPGTVDVVRELAESLVELASMLIEDAGDRLVATRLLGESSAVTVSPSRAALVYSTAGSSLEPGSGEASAIALAA